MSTATTVKIPRGAYCIEDAEWTRQDENGNTVFCSCSTYQFPNGKLAGFLIMETDVFGSIIDQCFDRA